MTHNTTEEPAKNYICIYEENNQIFPRCPTIGILTKKDHAEQKQRIFIVVALYEIGQQCKTQINCKSKTKIFFKA